MPPSRKRGSAASAWRSPQEPTADPDLATATLLALRHVVGPLVRLAIANQVLLPQVVELLKRIYVEQADAAFALPGRRQTDSRVTMLTGVYRKDIRRLRAAIAREPVPPPRGSLAQSVIVAWTEDPRYLLSNGEPAPLAVTEREGGERSFEALVAGISRDIGYRPLLDLWLHHGVVTQGADGRLQFDLWRIARALPAAAAVERVGRLLGSHAEALLEALHGDPERFLSGSAVEERLSEQSALQLQRLAKRLGTRALAQFNQRAIELRQRDRGRPGADRRIVFGMFCHDRPEPPPGR